MDFGGALFELEDDRVFAVFSRSRPLGIGDHGKNRERTALIRT